MGLGARLQLRQSQALVMTPQLMQSIKLLQLTHMELERFVEEEIERNPLLERAESDDVVADRSAIREDVPEADAAVAAADDLLTSEAIGAELDCSLENVFPDEPGIFERPAPDLSAQWKSLGKSSGAGSGSAVSDGFDMDDMAAAAVTLRDYAGEQISFSFSDSYRRLIACQLLENLDDDGYMRGDTGEIAALAGAAEGEVHAVLAVCQTFDPPGLFARDLPECLAIQLAQRDRLDPAMSALLQNLELLARRDFAALRRLCGVEEDDLLDMLAEIRALDPRPGARFTAGGVPAIVADVEVRAATGGGWSVELNPAALPRVLVDHAYFSHVSGRARDPSEKAFLSECLQGANWLARSLDQRARTILKVAGEIVRRQEAFLAQGVRHLRPLNLRTVADAVGMHESTVSRATANKYMLTPRGVFELRYFFTASIAASGGGEAHSSEAVKDRIREMIEGEEPSDVLSDDALVDRLRKTGVDIARRTVAKYREAMNIPSSVQRRREKRAQISAGRQDMGRTAGLAGHPQRLR